MILCNGRDLITYILCNDTEIVPPPPKFVYVMANPMNYTQISV